MNDVYKSKYMKYKSKYIKLKNYQTGGVKKCLIDDDDIVLFGNGGSSSIIAITKDNRVYKIFTLYNFISDLDI